MEPSTQRLELDPAEYFDANDFVTRPIVPEAAGPSASADQLGLGYSSSDENLFVEDNKAEEESQDEFGAEKNLRRGGGKDDENGAGGSGNAGRAGG